MLFNSLAFLIFLPTVLAILGLLPGRWRNPLLLVAGYFFYGCWDWRFLGLLFASTVIDFTAGRLMVAMGDGPQRKLVLVCAISANLLILGFFKYFNFFVDSLASMLQWAGVHVSMPTLAIVLPVGISFYTFQSMAYAIDVYRRDTPPADRFLDYATYVAYFPQLVAGPIERAGHLLPQIVSPARVTPERINLGLMLMLLGFVKKVLIADQLAPEVDRIFSDPTPLSAGILLKGAYYFSFQIYCDFSGYSDIARGVSELLGIRLRLNFNQPYLAQSITEFWRRWHMSLSEWLRDYLYISLGGNRGGMLATYRNLMLTMLIGGLWHGANWTFVVWGGLHGTYLVIERLLGVGPVRRLHPSGGVAWWAQRVGWSVLTFHLVMLAWVFFRAPDVASACAFLSGIVRMDHLAAVGVGPVLVAAAVLAIDIPQYVAGYHTVFLRLPWWVQTPAYATACFAAILWGGSDVPFIYFQF